MIQLDHLSKAFGGQTLFKDITWRINPGERVGLVGTNGAGKTTLCRILAGVEAADDGRIVLPNGYRIGYLPQEVILEGEHSLMEVVLEGKKEVIDLEGRLRDLTLRMAEASGADLERLNADYGAAEQRFVALDGYALRARARTILAGMGFDPDEADRSIHTFSGGWQMRALLCKLLLQSPDLLLMDEPTNHLDLPSLEWLEGFLRSYPGSVVIISHDRYFLNRMVTRVADMAHQTLILYKGNYDDFLDERAARAELLSKQADKQRKEIEHMEDFVRRFKAKATKARQAQSRVKALARMERIEAPRDNTRSVGFRFPQPPRSGQEVLRLDNIGKKYGDLIIYEGMKFRVERGERVALVGPNGAGKSTLLKILADSTPFTGERLPGYNVSIGFFAQHQVESLDLEATALEEMERKASPDVIHQVRGILGAFLFSGDTVNKKVSVLSGGEKSRLALAKMLLETNNLLLLEEPTNHLYIQSREVLEDALAEFQGTLIFISHDRHFINNLATRVVHVEHGALYDYPGDYEYYTWKRKQDLVDAAEAATTLADAPEDPLEDHTAEGKKARKRREAELRRLKADAMGDLKNRLDKTEAEIAAAEAEKGKLQALMADPALYEKGGAEVQRVTLRDRALGDLLEALYARWEQLAAEVEAVEAQFVE